MSEGSFQRVISEHLALAERNKRLERTMPLGPYREYYGGAADAPLSREAPEEPSTELNVVRPGRDESSWWDASEERPVPAEFDWGDGG
jgi:hypothetical protein